jgi:hypothetical protein
MAASIIKRRRKVHNTENLKPGVSQLLCGLVFPFYVSGEPVEEIMEA